MIELTKESYRRKIEMPEPTRAPLSRHEWLKQRVDGNTRENSRLMKTRGAQPAGRTFMESCTIADRQEVNKPTPSLSKVMRHSPVETEILLNRVTDVSMGRINEELTAS